MYANLGIQFGLNHPFIPIACKDSLCGYVVFHNLGFLCADAAEWSTMAA
jgi:hypothetical protein